jgi:hypothetical protein
VAQGGQGLGLVPHDHVHATGITRSGLGTG